jgi:hypothetical protein
MATTQVNAPPSLISVIAKYTPFVGNVVEAHEQPFWSTVTYPAAGFTQQEVAFFNVAESASSPSVTNMPQASQFPNPTNFLVLGAEINFFSGAAPTNGAGAGKTALDDLVTVMTGPFRFRFKVNNKVYYEDAPLAALPPHYSFGSSQAAALDDLASATTVVGGYGSVTGQVRGFSGIVIPSNTIFACSIVADQTGIALPSGSPGKLQVKLRGIYYTLAQ